MATKALTGEEIQRELVKLNAGDDGWRVENGKLNRTYQFHDFVEAFGFMAQAALIAERMNHHPEWFNVYRTVRVDLTTHDAGGISPLDFELAAAMDRLAG